jgi:hypothetical protein
MNAQICFGASSVCLPAGGRRNAPNLPASSAGENVYSPQFDTIAMRSAEFCVLDGIGQNTSDSCIGPNSPAPVETDRRPESPILSLFVADIAPVLLREGQSPAGYQEAAEDEPIMKG